MRVRSHRTIRAATATAALGLVVLLASCGEDSPGVPAGASSGTSGSSSGTSGTSGSSGTSGTSGTSGSSGTSGTSGAVDSGADASTGPLALTTTAYVNGGNVPAKHVCVAGAGQNFSPPLAWSGAPAGTMSYAIVMRDLDFKPNGVPFIHWAIWDIPGSAMGLAENVEHVATPAIPQGAKQAKFNDQLTGYQGPCSLNSVNTYELTLYAIPTATLTGITTASTKIQAAAAIVGAATATAAVAGES